MESDISISNMNKAQLKVAGIDFVTDEFYHNFPKMTCMEMLIAVALPTKLGKKGAAKRGTGPWEVDH